MLNKNYLLAILAICLFAFSSCSNEDDPVVISCEEFDVLLIENNGALVLEVIEGTAPYTYVWSTGATTATITPTEDGVFSVTVTDAEDCTTSEEIEFEMVVVDVCDDFTLSLDESNGSLAAEATGGTAPYTYVWSSGETTATITPTEDGVFSVIATDSEGCTNSDEIEFEMVVVNVCDDFTLFINESNGTLTAEAMGGTEPYTYMWSSGENTPMVTPAESGEYTITITDANGCTISELIAIVVADGCAGFEVNIVHDGELIVDIAGGLPPYEFDWSNGEFTNSISVTEDGVYSVTVTDAENCTTSDEISVLLDPSNCDNILNLNADTNTPVMFSAQSEGYLWKGNCPDLNVDNTFDHNYLVVDINWDSWGTNNEIGLWDLVDGMPAISFGSNGIPQVGAVLSPYITHTDNYYYDQLQGVNYDLDEVQITITETSDELGGEIAGTISGVLVSQNDVNDSATVSGNFCVPIVFVCE